MSRWVMEGRDVASSETNGVINVRHQARSRSNTFCCCCW